MLVDNKFIYLSLPRCASTSFHYSCIINNIGVKTNNGEWEVANEHIDFNSIEKEDLMNHIFHGHETISDLQSKFGIDVPVIAVNRERHERFYSFYKHMLSDFKRLGYLDFYDTFSHFTLNELFFFTKDDLISKKTRWDKISDYLIELKLINQPVDINVTLSSRKNEENYWKEKNGYLVNLIDILLTPISFWTNHNPNIIWFEFDKLQDLDKWVSDKTKKPFKIQYVNSSKNIKTNLPLDDNFVVKYNSIYDYYDLHKTTKTLI